MRNMKTERGRWVVDRVGKEWYAGRCCGINTTTNLGFVDMESESCRAFRTYNEAIAYADRKATLETFGELVERDSDRMSGMILVDGTLAPLNDIISYLDVGNTPDQIAGIYYHLTQRQIAEIHERATANRLRRDRIANMERPANLT